MTFGNIPGQKSHSDILVSVPLERVEQRRFVRVNKLLRVQYAFIPEQEEEPFYKKAKSLNISAGGMKLSVPESIDQGRQILLQFVLPLDNKYNKFIELSRVTRVLMEPGKEFFIGVEFSSISKNEFEFIASYVMRTIWSQMF